MPRRPVVGHVNIGPVRVRVRSPTPTPTPTPTPHQVYAEDEELLAKDFAVAFKKLTELGCGFPSMQLA